MKEGLTPIPSDEVGKYYKLHDHLTEESPYLSAIARATRGVVFVDGQYYSLLGGNSYVDGHEAVRTSELNGNMAEEWPLRQLTPEEAATHVRTSFQVFSETFGNKMKTPTYEYIEKVLAFVRGEIAERPEAWYGGQHANF